jgi:hypothetical protein
MNAAAEIAMAGVRVFFATNRNHQPGNKLQAFGGRFNPDGVAALRFGYADFADGAEGPKLTGVTVYPERKTPTGFKGGSERFLEDLRRLMSGEKSDTLVFVHGFNVSFTGALEAGARLGQDVKIEGRPVNVVVFSWPSEGQAIPYMSYYSDREDARASGPALARTYLKLRDYLEDLERPDYCERRLHLLAHSMGAYVLRQGLQAAVVKEPTALTRIFHEIMLAAPDEDDDAFELDTKLRLLPRLGRQVTVYFNPDDRALLISDNQVEPRPAGIGWSAPDRPDPQEDRPGRLSSGREARRSAGSAQLLYPQSGDGGRHCGRSERRRARGGGQSGIRRHKALLATDAGAVAGGAGPLA